MIVGRALVAPPSSARRYIKGVCTNNQHRLCNTHPPKGEQVSFQNRREKAVQIPGKYISE